MKRAEIQKIREKKTYFFAPAEFFPIRLHRVYFREFNTIILPKNK